METIVVLPPELSEMIFEAYRAQLQERMRKEA